MLYHLYRSVPMHKYAYHFGGLLGMVEFTFQHSLQFRDRSLDADSSGIPNTVEDVDVEDSALENSFANSYWFRACEETWRGDK